MTKEQTKEALRFVLDRLVYANLRISIAKKEAESETTRAELEYISDLLMSTYDAVTDCYNDVKA